jgi:DNA-binding transcriptional LysR family regulator
MLADAESVRRELAELAGLERGRVRLGATPTLCISLAAEVLSAFHKVDEARRLIDEARADLEIEKASLSDHGPAN